MVNFVLQSHGEQVFGLQGELFLVRSPGFYLDIGRAFHFGRIVNDAEAPFLPDDLAFAGGDHRVDELEQVLAGFFMVDIDNDDTLRDADLHRRQADTRRVIHRQHHIVYELDEVTGNILDRRARLFQPRVRKMKDFSDHYLTYNMLYGSTSTMTRTPWVC